MKSGLLITAAAAWRASLGLLAGAMCWALLSHSSLAAPAGFPGGYGPVVRVTSGEVLVNSGDGFHAIGTGTPLEPGSQLLASPNSSVTLVYPDGTLVPVQPGAVTFVSDVSAHAAAASTAGPSGWNTAVVEGPEDVAGLPAAPAGVPGSTFGLPTSTLFAVAGVGAAAAGAVAIASSGGTSAPASP